MKNRKGALTMTKKEMVDYMEKVGCVVDFDRKFLMRCLKEKVERIYIIVQEYATKHNIQV